MSKEKNHQVFPFDWYIEKDNLVATAHLHSCSLWLLWHREGVITGTRAHLGSDFCTCKGSCAAPKFLTHWATHEEWPHGCVKGVKYGAGSGLTRVEQMLASSGATEMFIKASRVLGELWAMQNGAEKPTVGVRNPLVVSVRWWVLECPLGYRESKTNHRNVVWMYLSILMLSGGLE